MVLVVFHVPTVYNDGEPIPAELIELLMNAVLEITGGFTVVWAEGAWLHEGSLIREPVMRVCTGVPEGNVESFVQMIDSCLKTDFEQIATWIEVDGKPSIL